MKTVRARLVAKGNQDPDLREGNVDIAGCESSRSPHLQLIPPGALKESLIWGLGIKNACSQSDGFDREVYLLASMRMEFPSNPPGLEAARARLWAQ